MDIEHILYLFIIIDNSLELYYNKVWFVDTAGFLNIVKPSGIRAN